MLRRVGDAENTTGRERGDDGQPLHSRRSGGEPGAERQSEHELVVIRGFTTISERPPGRRLEHHPPMSAPPHVHSGRPARRGGRWGSAVGGRRRSGLVLLEPTPTKMSDQEDRMATAWVLSPTRCDGSAGFGGWRPCSLRPVRPDASRSPQPGACAARRVPVPPRPAGVLGDDAWACRRAAPGSLRREAAVGQVHTKGPARHHPGPRRGRPRRR